MPILQYEQLFVGLLWVYHTDPKVDGTNKYLLGKIDCQLAYSYDGWHFQRTVREPFGGPSSIRRKNNGYGLR